MKKIMGLYLPLIFLMFLLLVSLFPKFFTNTGPNTVHLKNLKPNLGINSFEINNPDNHKLIVDSLFIQAGEKKIIVAENVSVGAKSSRIGKFQISNLELNNHRKDFRLFLYPATASNVTVIFNENSRKHRMRAKGKYMVGTIPRTDFFDNKRQRLDNRFLEKSFLGTDMQGRDTWSRMIYGSGIVIKIVILSLLISVPIGVLSGLIRGYYDNCFARLINVLVILCASIPVYLLTMMIVVVFQQKLILVVIAFSLVQWVEIERIIFHKVRHLKESDFILSAKSFGKSNFNIITSEILVLCFPEIIISSVFLAKRIILIEAGLSFLGYSVNIPYPSWGSIIASTRDFMMSGSARWLIWPPTLMIVFTALSFNALGNYLKQRLEIC